MSSAGERTALLKYKCLAADKWSLYPATQDVDMGCHSIIDVSGIAFCDGSTITHGASLDIHSGDGKTVLNSGSDTMVTVDDPTKKISLGITNETLLEVATGGNVAINQTGLTGNPLISLFNTDGDEGQIFKKSTATGGDLVIDNGLAPITIHTNDAINAISDNGVITITAPNGDVNINGSALVNMTGNNIIMSVPGETNVTIIPGGILAIDQTGIISGNDPILSLKSVGGGEARIRRTETGPLQINNDGDAIQLQVGSVTTATINASGNMALGGSGNDGSLSFFKGDESDIATINYIGGSQTLSTTAQDMTMTATVGSVAVTSAQDLIVTVGNVTNILQTGTTNTVQLQTSGGSTGNIIVDEGATEFVFKADGVNQAIVRAATIASVQALNPDAGVSMITGAGETIIDCAADGAGSGKITIKAETNGGADPPISVTLDGWANRDVVIQGVTVPVEGIRDTTSSIGLANQILSATAAGGSTQWIDVPNAWGSFCHDSTTVATNANVTYFSPLNVDLITPPLGCARNGVADVQMSVICRRLRLQASIIASGAATNTKFKFWLVKTPNGGSATNVANSCSEVIIKTAGDEQLVVCEWYDSCVVGDKYKVAFQADTANASMVYVPAGGADPNKFPASPSIILTVQGFA